MKTLTVATILVAVIAVFASSARASAPGREFVRDFDETFVQPTLTANCGVTITEEDIGGFFIFVFFNRDGSIKSVTEHDPAVTSIFTNTVTGAKATVFGSLTVPQTSTITTTANGTTEVDITNFLGLNYILRTADGTQRVAAGFATRVDTFTFDAAGNLISAVTTFPFSTPNDAHLRPVLQQALCPA